MKDLLGLIKNQVAIQDYFPVEEEIAKCGKEWVSNMLYSLCKSNFVDLVKSMEMARKVKIDATHQLNVSSTMILQQILGSRCSSICREAEELVDDVY